MDLQREAWWYAETKLKRDFWKLASMYYDVIVFENPAYKGIMRLPLNIIYFMASCWQGTCCSLLWCDTNGRCCLQKALGKAVTVSGMACYITVLLIYATWGPLPKFSNCNAMTMVLPHCVHKSRFNAIYNDDL